MFLKLSFLIQLIVAVNSYTYKKPDKPCELKDEVCLTKMVSDIFTAAVNGEPSAGFEAIDPMHIDEIIANLPTVNFTLKDCTVLRLSELQVQTTSISDHDSVNITLMFPRYDMYGTFEANGTLLDTPLMGVGNFDLKANDIKIEVEAMEYYYKKDDGIHLKLDRFEFTIDSLEKRHLTIESFFNENRETADSTLKLLKSNVKMLAAAWSYPKTRSHFNKIFNNVNIVLEGVLLKDLTVEDL